jgi:hypothetical protein
MRHIFFILELLFRRHERVHGETDFLGFEAFTQQTGTNDSSTTSSGDKATRKAV